MCNPTNGLRKVMMAESAPAFAATQKQEMCRNEKNRNRQKQHANHVMKEINFHENNSSFLIPGLSCQPLSRTEACWLQRWFMFIRRGQTPQPMMMRVQPQEMPT